LESKKGKKDAICVVVGTGRRKGLGCSTRVARNKARGSKGEAHR